MNLRHTLFGTCALLTIAQMCDRAFAWPQVIWGTQIGSIRNDYCGALDGDAGGNLFQVGAARGIAGVANVGLDDAFVAKYNSSGTLAWARQLGTTNYDYGRGVAADSTGNSYICGTTKGNLASTNAGFDDAFIARYDPDGTLLWKKQVGGALNDAYTDVSTDSTGNAYACGNMNDAAGIPYAVLTKYGPSGTELWTRSIASSPGVFGHGDCVDASGNIYIMGSTAANLAGTVGSLDIFVAKYNSVGDQLWLRQMGSTGWDTPSDMTVDNDGSVYISGYTEGSLPGFTQRGNDDAFLAKYDATGNLIWQRQIGTPSADNGYAIAADASGRVFFAGFTSGTLETNATNPSGPNAFLQVYNASGDLVTSDQFGSPDTAAATALYVDVSGNIILSGHTTASLFAQNVGWTDVFLEMLAFAGNADANSDGSVDTQDFNVLAGHFGQTGALPISSGNFNGDLVVDSLDLNILIAQYGRHPASAAPGSAVPEPGSLALLSPAAILAQRRRRR